MESSFDYQSMYNTVKDDYRGCIEQYREMSDTFLLGWLVDMEQSIKIQDWETTQSVDDNGSVSRDVTVCPLDGVINVVHHFEAQSFIPISGTVVTVYEDGLWDTEIKRATTDSNGVARIELDKLKYAGKPLVIKVEPDLNKSHIEELFGSYDSVMERAIAWLDNKWATAQVSAWTEYVANPLDAVGALEEFLDAFLDAIKDVWDDLKMIFEMLSHPDKLWQMIQKFCDPAEMSQMLESAKQEVEKMLILLKDEARLFLCINAIYSWFRTFTPSQVFTIAAAAAAALLVEVILNLIMPGGIFRKVLTQFDSIDDLLEALN
ncbi:hypothetical protein [uncultured Neptuniibacter sp.]|uniref:hypothetical protein n=1 Tax=uncultured Neptuniibacter sp. TaxID=502143 RepID=UPI0032B2FB89|tara:strand:+ start:8896 stop:9852 length:957 start_codon:yes stop_codon:yes gene_type:complete